MCRDLSARYAPCAPTTPGEIRRFVDRGVRAEVGGGDVDEALDSVHLVVSELATNAVQAGCDSILVDLQVRHGHVRVSVQDDANGWPTPQSAGPHDEHGRGLAIVAAVANRWGVEPTRRGKQVWADLDLPPGLTHESRCEAIA